MMTLLLRLMPNTGTMEKAKSESVGNAGTVVWH